ncbi:MAG: hypothetical protein CMJ83_03225 [Planctomycetes bacterium]|nr:hypothetical protein [Planctomycetota bacterium]
MPFLTLACLLIAPLVAAQGPGVGDAAPAFRLNDQYGAAHAFPPKAWSVLAFYPKASTGG